MIVGERIREATARAFLVLEDIVHDLVIESSVREIHLTRRSDEKRWQESDPPKSTAAVYCLRSVCETNQPDEESFFPVGAVAVGLERADASLGLEEGGGIYAGGERDVVAGAIAWRGQLAKRLLWMRSRWRMPSAGGRDEGRSTTISPIFGLGSERSRNWKE